MHCFHRLQVFASMDCGALKSSLFTSSTLTTTSLVLVYSNFFSFILVWVVWIIGLVVGGCLDCLFGVLRVVWTVSLRGGLFILGEALIFWPFSSLFSLTTSHKPNVFAIMKRISQILRDIGAVNVGEHTGQ